MKTKSILTALAISALPALAWGEGCTIDVPPVTLRQNALSSSVNGFYGSLVVNVTCPAGQAWTLSTAPPSYINPSNGATTATIYTCRTGYAVGTSCASYPLQTSASLATGVGTGAPQQAILLAMSGTAANRSFSGYLSGVSNIFMVTTYGPRASGSTYFKVNSGGVDTTSAVTVTAIVDQACGIELKNNMAALSYTGVNAPTGSMAFNFGCGYSDTGIPFSLTIGPGSYPLNGVRRATKTGGYIGYHLYWDSGYSQEIGASAGNSQSISTTSYSTSMGTKTIYGKVLRDDAAHAPKGNGIYTDVVVVSVDY